MFQNFELLLLQMKPPILISENVSLISVRLIYGMCATIKLTAGNIPAVLDCVPV